MKSLARLAVTAGAAAATCALFAVPANATPAHHSGSADRSAPVFVQNDSPKGNTVYVYDRAADGTLRKAGTYPTGGAGGQLPDSVVDHLAGQGSLTYDRAQHLLYAVNAGSNSVTVFAVRGDRLERRQVVRSGGSFPVSVTAHGDLVYVLNGEKGGSIQAYLNIGGFLAPTWNRKLGLSTTVPAGTAGFLEAPGQVTFTPDGRDLVVTTKANGSDIEVFRVGLLGLLGKPVVTHDETDGAPNVPFDVSFDSGGRLDVSEAGANTIARYTLKHDGSLSLVSRVPTNAQATCWIVTGPTGDRLYVDNAGSATITTANVTEHGALTVAGSTSTDGGDTDATIPSDGRDLYVQTGAAGVVDEFAIAHDGTLTKIGSITVPDAVGGEGIASA